MIIQNKLMKEQIAKKHISVRLLTIAKNKFQTAEFSTSDMLLVYRDHVQRRKTYFTDAYDRSRCNDMLNYASKFHMLMKLKRNTFRFFAA